MSSDLVYNQRMNQPISCQPLREFDLLLFDLDGTLVDSRRDIHACANHMLRTLGLPEKDLETVIATVGNGVETHVTSLIGEGNMHRHAEGVAVFRSYMGILDDFKTELYEGTKETLEYFSDIKKAIVTNRPTDSARYTLERLGIITHFDCIFGGDVIGQLKPSPWMIDQASEKFAVDKTRILMIGDMDADVLAGKNAGVTTCAARYGLLPRDHIFVVAPDFEISAIHQLKCLVKSKDEERPRVTF
jgi:phosphoglycolate phosphatase